MPAGDFAVLAVLAVRTVRQRYRAVCTPVWAYQTKLRITNRVLLRGYQKRVKIKYQKQVEKRVSYAGFSADLSAASIAFDQSRCDGRCSWGGTPATRFTAERNQMKDKKMSIRISAEDLNIVHYKAEQAKLTLTEYVITESA